MVIGANALAAARYCGLLYREVLVPGGTADQPYLAATSESYCLEVAQDTNFQAAPALAVPCGMPSDQVHSHPEDLVRFTGANAYPVCANTDGKLPAMEVAATVASYHIAHLPCPYSVSSWLKLSFEAPGSPYLRTRLT